MWGCGRGCENSRYGLPVKLDRNLSANQITKIVANERQNSPPVNRKACVADVIAASLAFGEIAKVQT